MVLGTHGRTGIARMILGSVAGAVIAKSRVPVMTVRNAAIGEHEGRTEAEEHVGDEADG